MTEERKQEALRLPQPTRGMKRFSLVLFFLGGVVLTTFVLLNPLGIPFLPQASSEEEPSVAVVEEPTQLYQCPMHPEVIEKEPANCPICRMKLTPMQTSTVESEEHVSGVIQIDPAQVQNIGVVSKQAFRSDVTRSTRTVGILDFNADRVSWVNTKYSGWVEKVHVNYVGQDVQKGQPLFDIYSPELVTTQEEYLRALDYRESLELSDREEARRQADSLVHSSRDRLMNWDISEGQIDSLENNREVQRLLTVRSPSGGVVAEIMEESLEGVFVKAGINLYKIADISSLWVHADVYESDLPWVREGLPAEISLGRSDRTFRGKVLFLYPEVSKDTRTLKICVEVPNTNNRLRAGMYTDVMLYGPIVKDAVLIPNSAVLRSGERDLVFIDLGEGRFEPREIRLGIRGEGDDVQVLEGVQAGEKVVTQAQFMLDSESRVQEAIQNFMHNHGG
jgi:Cu(I)/Ag(I) efflux system membrane fusion protein/cobalt-zinc-cadmium efflux system membrane fusion protein